MQEGTSLVELNTAGESLAVVWLAFKTRTLRPGDIIAQLFFHDVAKEESMREPGTFETGQYIGAVDLLPRTMSPAVTFEKLKKLQEVRSKEKETAISVTAPKERPARQEPESPSAAPPPPEAARS
jgi:hypothetical protein